MEQRVRELLLARAKTSGWMVPERAGLLQEILAAKEEVAIKPLPIPRRRLRKVGAGAEDKENSPTEDLNVTRCEPTPSAKRAHRVLDDDTDETEAPATAAAPTPAILAALPDTSPVVSPLAGKPSPARDADLHRQQLLDLANDIENLRFSMGSSPPAQDAEGDSSAASEAASTSVQEEAATPVKPAVKDATAQKAQTAPVAAPVPIVEASPAVTETKKLDSDEPSECSVLEKEEEEDDKAEVEEPLNVPQQCSDDGEEEGEEEQQQPAPVSALSPIGSASNTPIPYLGDATPDGAAAISVDEGADEQATAARRLLQEAAIFNSPVQRRDSPAPIASPAAADSPLIIRRAAAPRRVVMSDSEEQDAPTPAIATIAGSKLRIVETRSESEEEEEPAAPKAKATVKAEADDEAEEAEEESADAESEAESNDDSEEGDEDEEEAEERRPRNPFVDSEAEEASTPEEKPKARSRSRKSDVWLVDDDAQETVLSEEDDEEEPAGETLHSSDSDSDAEEEAEAEPEPKTPAKKTATSQPIMQTPISKTPSVPSTPLAHTPGTHFQRGKAAMTAAMFAEYNKRAFDNKLDPAMAIRWTNKLKTTAGRTLLKRRGTVRFAEVELENKVVDCEIKLRRTLLHELCHAAAWVIDGASRPPHGRTFWKWADHAKHLYPQYEVRTCHSYVINFKHHWTCARCSRVIGRHSKSIKATDRCACGGELAYQAPLKADGTPRWPAAANPYTQFVKENFAAIKAKNPRATQKEVMLLVSEAYKQTPRKGSA